MIKYELYFQTNFIKFSGLTTLQTAKIYEQVVGTIIFQSSRFNEKGQ